MGYSCSAAASKVMEAWSRECELSTDSQNCYVDSDGIVRFWERSDVEHPDGAVTGTIWKQASDGRCYRAGTFKINGDGIDCSRAEMVARQADRARRDAALPGAAVRHDHASLMNRCIVDGKCCYEP